METKKIIIEGTNIVYSQMGHGPVILYIHGNLGSRIWFERNMNIPGYKTIALDMPNFGDSDPIQSYSMNEYGRMLTLFSAKVAEEGIALLVGHSLGGAVAMEVAFRIPEKIGALLLVDSCPINGLQTPEAYHPVIDQYKTNRELLTKALRGVVPFLKDESLLERLVEQAVKMNSDAFIGHAVELGKVNYSVPASNFLPPVLVIRGEEDVLITCDMAQTLAEAFPSGNFISFPDAGHSLMLENPDIFNNIVKEFLS